MRRKSLLPIIGSLIIQLLLGGSIKGSSAETSSIYMATDKTRYARGEMIKIVVTNNLDTPIWYIGYPQRELVFWRIEQAKENNHSYLVELSILCCRLLHAWLAGRL